MSRETPKLDGGLVSSFSDISLSDDQLADISAACGVAVDCVRNGLASALNFYRLHTLARENATPIAVAEKRLDRLLALATELHGLNALTGYDTPEWSLRNDLMSQLDWPDKAATRLYNVLDDYIRAAKRARAEVTEKRKYQGDPSQQLAYTLSLIWTDALHQARTISASNGGSAFVKFVMATTENLPSHWPWRLAGSRRYQSLDAFVKALGRELDT